MIKGYKEGSDITILNAKYCWPKRLDTKQKKYDDGFMTILYKDQKTGKKARQVIKNPDYIFYELDRNVSLDHNLMFIEEDKVREISVPYKDLLLTLAEDSGMIDSFYMNIKTGNRRANQNLHMNPRFFNTDMHIEDHYRFRFDRMYKNEPIRDGISKAYLDIEVDTKYMEGDFPELGECPINIATLIDVDSKTINVFCLEDEEYEGLEDFKKGLKDGSIFDELRKFIYNHMGFDKKKKISRFYKYEIDKFEFKFHFYDSLNEIGLIADLFALINKLRPDFLMAWNMPFDIPYIIERVIALGFDPKDILCAKGIPKKERYCTYFIDNFNRQVPEKRGDYFEIAGYTVYLDQLVEFASRRKGQAAFDNMKLDNIGNIVTGIGKLDMHKYAKNFKSFPRKAYKWFTFYNIVDVLVQHCIEFEVGDIDFVFNKSLLNNTRYNKAHKQTIYLTNRGIKEFRKEGFIMGNNVNRNNPKPKVKFPGALVGDPLNNNDFAKMRIGQFILNICNNLDDYDFKALYPSVMSEYNIAPNTQIGKIIIPNKVHDKENLFNYSKYDRGGQFLEDYQCDSPIEFCSRWFHLAGYTEILEDMDEYFLKFGYNGFIQNLDNRAVDIVHFISHGPIDLVYSNNTGRSIPLVTYMRSTNNSIPSIREDIKSKAQVDIYDYEKILRRKQNDEEEESVFDEFDEDEYGTTATSEFNTTRVL